MACSNGFNIKFVKLELVNPSIPKIFFVGTAPVQMPAKKISSRSWTQPGRSLKFQRRSWTRPKNFRIAHGHCLHFFQILERHMKAP